MNIEKTDRSVDVRGQLCPYPVIEMKLALKRLGDGQVLEVLTDYEPTVRTTVPAFCERANYPFTINELERKTWQVLIQKHTEPR
jgi:tRNA 2-thiouridine synthesizing protein A